MNFIWRTLGFTITTVAVVAALALGLIAAEHLDRKPRTDDAFLYADVVHVTPEVSGRLVELNIRQNQKVNKGQVLMVIDPESYALKVAQAQAQVHSSEASLEEAARKMASQSSQADAADSNVLSAETSLAQATSSLARMQPLLARGYVSAQQVDQARTSQQSAQISLQQSRQQARSSRESVSSTKPQEAQLEESRAQLASAERDLRLTVVTAPCDGRITGLDVAVGEYATQGKSLFTIIDTERWYAVGNYRETELPRLSPGQSATIYALSQPDRPLRGHIEGLGFGVSPDEGTMSNGLPAIPRSLNWVRIAQRFPLRVLIDEPPEDLMRLGASAVVIIDR